MVDEFGNFICLVAPKGEKPKTRNLLKFRLDKWEMVESVDVRVVYVYEEITDYWTYMRRTADEGRSRLTSKSPSIKWGQEVQ